MEDFVDTKAEDGEGKSWQSEKFPVLGILFDLLVISVSLSWMSWMTSSEYS